MTDPNASRSRTDIPSNLTADEAAGRILRLLRSRCPADRLEAEAIVRGLGPAAQPTVAAVVRQCGRSWRLGRALVLVSAVCATAAIAGPIGTGIGLLVWAAAAVAALCVEGFVRSRVQPSLIDQAGGLFDALEGPAAVGVLADALWMGEPRARADVARHVARVLSGLAAEDAAATAPDVRLRLYRALKAGDGSSRRTPLQLSRDFHPSAWRAYDSAVVEFCRRTDDTLALPYVSPLASGRESEKVTAEARSCVAHLREVAARQAEAAPLLRPAGSPCDDALLRPAEEISETPAEQLLRAAGDDGV